MTAKLTTNKSKSSHDRKGLRPLREAADQAAKAVTVIEPTMICEYRERHPKVTDDQAALVAEILQVPGPISQAATALGKNKSWAYETLKKPHVLAYSTELARASVGIAALQALATQRSLLSTKSDYLKHEVAKDILDRAGFRVGAVQGRGAEVEISIKL